MCVIAAHATVIFAVVKAKAHDILALFYDFRDWICDCLLHYLHICRFLSDLSGKGAQTERGVKENRENFPVKKQPSLVFGFVLHLWLLSLVALETNKIRSVCLNCFAFGRE